MRCPYSSPLTRTETSDSTISQPPTRLLSLFPEMGLKQIVPVTLYSTGKMDSCSELMRSPRCMSVSSIHSSLSTVKMVITMISQCPPPATSDSPEPITPHIASNDVITRSHYYLAVAVYSSNTWSICGLLTKATSIISATTSRTSGASLHSGLADTVDNRVDLHNVGQQFVLPSSYTGGPR